MTHTGALSVASPKHHSDHQLYKRPTKNSTSSGSQEQIVLQLWELIHCGHPLRNLPRQVPNLLPIPRPDRFKKTNTLFLIRRVQQQQRRGGGGETFGSMIVADHLRLPGFPRRSSRSLYAHRATLDMNADSSWRSSSQAACPISNPAQLVAE